MVHRLLRYYPIFLFIFSAYVVYQWMSNLASPFYAAIEWVTAMERGDYGRAMELSLWQGKRPTEEDLRVLAASFKAYPEWKEKTFKQLVRSAYSLSRGEEGPAGWFHVRRPPFSLSMKVEIPSVYLKAEGEGWENTHLTFLPLYGDKGESKALTSTNGIVGPLLPIPQTIRMEKDTKWGRIVESRRIDYEKMWGEELLSFLPLTPYSSFTVMTDVDGATLWIDGEEAGEVKGSYEAGPLPYEPHSVRLRKVYPWGTATGDLTWLRPGEKEVFLSMDPVTPTLVQELGATIRDYLDGWVNAGRDMDSSAFVKVEDGLRKILEEELNGAQPNRLEGGFVRFDLDPSSITLMDQKDGTYRASVVGREIDDQLRWVTPEGSVVKEFPEESDWRYTLHYEPGNGWRIEDMTPLTDRRGGEGFLTFHSFNYLRFATDAGYPPFESWKDGELTGFDIEFLTMLAKEENRIFTLSDMPYHQILEKMKEGEMDGMIAGLEAGKIKEPGSFLRSAPYLVLEEKALMVSPCLVSSSWMDQVRRVGLMSDSPSISALNQWVKEGEGREAIPFSLIEEGIKALKEGKIDVFLIDPDLLLPEEKEGLFTQSWPGLPKREFFLLLQPTLGELLPALNEGIKRMTESSSVIQDLKRKYLRPSPSSPLAFLPSL